MNTLRVKAARPGLRVPREGSPQRHITHDQAETVKASPYYRRRIDQGDLVEVSE